MIGSMTPCRRRSDEWSSTVAESTVVEEQLTQIMIASGANLTKQLDAFGVHVTAALWSFMPELGDWRLLFASPDLST